MLPRERNQAGWRGLLMVGLQLWYSGEGKARKTQTQSRSCWNLPEGTGDLYKAVNRFGSEMLHGML